MSGVTSSSFHVTPGEALTALDSNNGGVHRSSESSVGMALDRETVLHVARLARLDLTESEAERLTLELGAILEAVSKVAELDLADVPPTSHPLDLVNVWADDEPRASLALEDALANAPEAEDGLFRVPAWRQ